jgi:signal transduction histidine kinase/ligand-binding sensor domain-containing protein
MESIAQTPDGYLWLGTDLGLLRFDGVRALPWQPPPGQHLPSDLVYKLLAARDGTLWIATSKGLASLKGGKLTLYAEIAGQIVYSLLQDREGTIWAGEAAIPTARLCSIQNERVHCYGEDGSFGDAVYGLYQDRKGNLWAGVRNGLWRWKPGPAKFFALPGELDAIRGLGEDDDGTLLVGMRGGIKRFIDGKIEAYPLSRKVPQFTVETTLLRDHDGGLWIATEDLGIVHVHQGKTDVFKQSDGLSGDTVSCLFEDREGTIWVGTFNGLDRFRDFAVATYSLKQGLSNALVTSILATRDGSVWLGNSVAGLNRWKNGQITVFGKAGGKLNGQAPDSLFQERSGRIWVSTLAGVGYLQNDRFIPTNGIPEGRVLSIAEDTAGNLWIAKQDQGLLELRNGNVVQRIPWARLGHRDTAMVLAADPVQGGLWMGFFGGGVAFFKDGEVRASFSAANGLGAGRVTGLLVESDDTVWAATEGGLSRLKNGRVATLGSKNGLSCDLVYGVMEDEDHSLWLQMACGLVRLARSELNGWTVEADKGRDEKTTLQATVFDSSDGVRTRGVLPFYSPQVATSSDGKLWFASNDGVSVIDPRNLPFNKLPPPVHIEQVTADRKDYDVVSDPNANVRLPPLVHDLEIDYAALSFVASEKVIFRYKLEGLDRDWHDAGNRRQAFYSNLPPRNYRFRVMACNNSGVWNEAGTFLDFSVAPAYYQTTWFRVMCGAALLALLWTLYQLRLQQLAREFNAGLEARVNERTRIARELHDSLLQGFQGLMFRLQAVRDLLPGRPDDAIEALDTALERGDKAIAEGRDTVSDLRESIIGEGDIATALTALGEELAAQNGNGSVPCVRVLVEGKQRKLDPVLRDEIYRIGREAFRNAFRHARAQKIEAEIAYGDSEFLFHVRDDGIGIAPEVADHGARAGHWGLPGMRERAKSFGGKLEVWSERGAGTEIKLIVPAAIAYGGPEASRRFWFSRKKVEGTDEQQS